MTNILFWLLAAIIICFGSVVLFGAPYLPTLKKQQKAALKLLDLKPGETLLELGCGDGRVLLVAARQGIKGVGYELNPILYIVALISTWRYRHLVTVRFGDYWQAKWPPADGIYIFLLQKYMNKLDKKIVQSNSDKIKLVSFAFTIPNKKPKQTKDGLYLYEYIVNDKLKSSNY